MAEIYRRPDANVVATADRIKARLPQLRAALPAGIDRAILSDQTLGIRASLHDLERTLLIAGALVIRMVFAFLRSFRAAIVTAVVVPVSLIGTFGIMYLLGHTALVVAADRVSAVIAKMLNGGTAAKHPKRPPGIIWQRQ